MISAVLRFAARVQSQAAVAGRASELDASALAAACVALRAATALPNNPRTACFAAQLQT